MRGCRDGAKTISLKTMLHNTTQLIKKNLCADIKQLQHGWRVTSLSSSVEGRSAMSGYGCRFIKWQYLYAVSML